MMENDAVLPAFASADHDHEVCVGTAVAAAETLCIERRQRLTALRRQVLELVWNSHRPVGAYEILEMLRQERGRVAPPTIYRALDFLSEQGLVHRIESLNAFVGCAYPGETHRAYFMICSRCRTAAEITESGVRRAVRRAAERAGFQVQEETVELRGICPDCRTA